MIADRLPTLKPFVTGKRVMDLGCVDSRREKHADAADRFAHKHEHQATFLHTKIAELASETLGVDIDPEGVSMLNDAGFNVVVGDVETMDPPPAGPYDTVVAGEIIEHLENPGLFLRNMLKMTAAGGSLLVSTPNPFYAGSAWKVWRNGEPSVHDEHMGWQDPITLAQLFRRTGWEPAEFWWVQPEAKVLKTWKRLARPYFSHTFMMRATPA